MRGFLKQLPLGAGLFVGQKLKRGSKAVMMLKKNVLEQKEGPGGCDPEI